MRRQKPTLGAIQAAIAFQRPPRNCPDCGVDVAWEPHAQSCRLVEFTETGKTYKSGSKLIVKRKDSIYSRKHNCYRCRWCGAFENDVHLPGCDKPSPGPSESAEHKALADWIALQWWAKGVKRPESQARRSQWEQQRLKDEGGAFGRGMPDWMVLIPWQWKESYEISFQKTPIRLALELKRRSEAPKRPGAGEEWWLSAKWPWQIKGEVENDQSKHYGLTWAQAKTLRLFHGAGFQTMVAYGHDEAREWLERMCGPKPDGPIDWGDE